MNIDNLEEDFLPSQKVTHVYGAVNINKEVKSGELRKRIGPLCSSCGTVSLESAERYCQMLRLASVPRCKIESKTSGGRNGKSPGDKEIIEKVEKHTLLKKDPASGRFRPLNLDSEKKRF